MGHSKRERKCHSKGISECDLRVAFRKLWSEHAIYTKFFIISVLAGIPDADLLATRLLKNQDDIGDFLKPYIGENKGNQLAQALKSHILAAANVIVAVRDGNQAAIDAAIITLFINSNQVATFISSLDPCKLPFNVIKAHFDQHNQFVIDMTIARKNGNFAEDIRLFDLYYAQILHFADLLFDGLIRPCL